MATKGESPSKKCVSDFGDNVLGVCHGSGDPDVILQGELSQVCVRTFDSKQVYIPKHR
jgi:hypothetical protein